MRQIRFIIVNDSSAQVSGSESRRGHVSNLGYHFTISGEGHISNPLNIGLPGAFFKRKTLVTNNYHQCSIGIHLGFRLEDSTPEARAALIRHLDKLRNKFPNAMIFGFSEISGDYFRVNPEMNRLRQEMSEIWEDG
jgi:hypothetical protein